MKESTHIIGLAVLTVTRTALKTGAKSATTYVTPQCVVKVTRRHKPRAKERHTEFVLSMGVPNYAERRFVKLCQRAGEPFPVAKPQLKFWKK